MKKYLSIVLLAVAATSLTSCLKDKNVNLAPGASPAVVEWSTNLFVAPTSAVNSTYPLYTKSFAVVPAATQDLVINYTGGDVAPKDINVTIDVNTAALTQYNTEHAADLEQPYTLMPASTYTLPTTVTIPRGQSRVTLTIAVKPDQFDLTKSYALPLRINTSDATVSGNYGTILVNFGAKNRVDGLYNLKTTANTSLQPSINHDNVPLVTVGPTTVRTNLLDTYSNLIVYNVDATTNFPTAVSVQGLATPTTDPSSTYNPTTKVMHIVWRSGTRFFDETYTYTGVR